MKNDRSKKKVDYCSSPRDGVVNVIIGEKAAGRDLNSTRMSFASSIMACSVKKNASFNQNIIFGDEGLIIVASPHDDAIVVVGGTTNFEVKRVLVDGVIVANVLI